MEQQSNNILNAVIQDNLTLFNELLIKDSSLKKIKFGRFSLLCLCYLFNSKKIIKFEEKSLLKISQFFVVSETNEIREKFRHIAGKSLRLFSSDIDITTSEIILLTKNKYLINSLLEKKVDFLERDQKLLELTGLDDFYKIENSKLLMLNSYKAKQNRQIKLTCKIIFSVCLMIVCLLSTLNILMINLKYNFSIVIDGEEILCEQRLQSISVSSLQVPQNCIFSGWFLDENFSEPLTSEIIKSNTKLFAKTTLLGDGTETSPYLIYSETQLKKISENKNAFFRIENDIALTKEITSIKDFSGVFDGNNKTISNTISKQNTIFVSVKTGAIIKNLKLESCVISTLSNSFGLLTNLNEGKILNVSANVNFNITINSENFFIGGIVSDNKGEISNCNVNIAFTGLNNGTDCFVGGIVGKNSGKITNSSSAGSINAEKIDIGGICGYNLSLAEINQCINSCSLSEFCGVSDTWNVYVGGVVSINEGTVQNCSNSGNLSGVNNNTKNNRNVAYAGGIAGLNLSSINKCFNVGKIYGSAGISAYAGGIAGSNSYSQNSTGIVSESYSNGEISAKSLSSVGYISLAGGIVGRNDSAIQKCFAYGENKVVNGFIGGVVGVANGTSTVADCMFLAFPQTTNAVGFYSFYAGSEVIVTPCQSFSELENWEFFWKDE